MQRALTEELAAGVRSLVASRLGLAFPPHRTRELEQALSGAALESGTHSVAAFAERLLASPVAPADLGRLGRHLTIGETYFFRDDALFATLETQVLPRLIRARAGTTRRLSVWSAGCSTGEEAYSLAILLARLLPDQDGWSVSIVGSDVNPAAVLAAQRGVYGQWSFRSTPDWVLCRYFVPAGKGKHQVAPWLRERVTFTVHNLVEDPFPAIGLRGEVDLVLCRNVLMYFAPRQARGTVERFASVLSPDGWLVVSPYEASDELLAGLERDRSVDAPLYRLPRRPERQKTPKPGEAQPAPEHGAVTKARRERGAHHSLLGGRAGAGRRAGGAVRRAPAVDEAARRERAVGGGRLPFPVAGRARQGRVPGRAAHRPAGPEALRRRAKEAADRGDLDEAADLCAAAIAADRTDPRSRYLLAAVEMERGGADRAARALNEAIYLDPGFVLAHVALGSLRSAQGRLADARRSYATALALLEARRPREEVEGSEGLTVLDLMTLVGVAASELSSLDAAGADGVGNA